MENSFDYNQTLTNEANFGSKWPIVKMISNAFL